MVKRKHNGIWAYHPERMIGKDNSYDTAYSQILNRNGQYLVDSASLENTGIAVDETFSGELDHLEGLTPDITVSNSKGIFAVVGSAVTAGSTTIQGSLPSGLLTEASSVVVGLGFDSIIEPVRIEAGSQIGTSHGAIKRIHKATVRFNKSMYAKVGADANNLEEVNFREGSTPMENSAEFFTGDKQIHVDCDYDRDGYLYIINDEPLPFSVISIISEGVTYD